MSPLSATVIGPSGARLDRPPSTELLEAEVRRRVDARLEEEAASSMARRWRRLRQNPGAELVRRVEVAGDEEPWWIKRGGFPDLALVAMLAGRDEQGALRLESGDDVSGFIAAVLCTFVVAGENDRSPAFQNLPEARAFCDDADGGVADAVATLFYAAVELNPEVWPEGEAAVKNVWRALEKARLAESSSSLATEPPAPCESGPCTTPP